MNAKTCERMGADGFRAGGELGMLTLVLLAGVLAGCQSSAHRTGGCDVRRGQTADELVRCGCVPAPSGGSMVMTEPGGSGQRVVVNTVHYVCPLGNARYARVAVVNGRVDGVWY